MKCSVFIATSADGYIAKCDGSVDWLHTCGDQNADMSRNPDMGFNAFIKSVDSMIMGRKCLETIASMNLTTEQWPYGDIKIIALSRTLSTPPKGLPVEVDMYAGDIAALISELSGKGYQHAYIDGGATITAFLNLNLIDEMIITQAPVVLGSGIPLFGKLDSPIDLEHTSTNAFANHFMQTKYKIRRD